MWLALFIFLIFTILGAYLFFTPSANAKGVGLMCMILFGSLGMLSLYMIFRLREKIVITDQSISSIYPSREPITLKWNEIEKLKDRPMLQRLEIHGFNSFVILKLENQLENFERGRAIVLEKTRFFENQNVEDIVLPATFPKSTTFFVIVILYVLCFTVLPIFAVIQKEYWGVLFFLLNLVWIFSWYKAEVHPDKLLLYYPLHTHTIEASEIRSISMETQHYKGNVLPIVILTLFDGKSLSLGGTKNGILPFYKAICMMKENPPKESQDSSLV
ncbi:MAG: hypothetical protein AABZ60_00580 [Planctomycetota bacterium]